MLAVLRIRIYILWIRICYSMDPDQHPDPAPNSATLVMLGLSFQTNFLMCSV